MKQLSFLFCVSVVAMNTLLAQTRITPWSNVNQSEPHIAVNPTNPKNIVVVAITEPPPGIGAYYTTDGGESWNGSDQITLPSEIPGDPVIAFDGNGIAFCLYQVRGEKKLYIRKSSDGGATWGNRTVAFQTAEHDDLDRPWMAISDQVNTAGEYDIYISVTYVPPTYNNQIVLRRSTDGGNTFGNVYTFGTGTERLHGSYVALGPSNKIYVAYAHVSPATFGVTRIEVQSSTDNGSSWMLETNATVNQIGERVGTEYYIKSRQIRADSYPRLAVDNSPNPLSRGTVYLMWAVQSTSSTDIEMMKRAPNGTWSMSTSFAYGPHDEWAAEERVSDGTGGFGFPSLVAFGRADGLDYPLGFASIAPRT